MNKKIIVGIAVISISLALVLGQIIFAAPTWIIDGDKVYIEETWGKLEVYPHTITSSGWVYFNATPYQDFGELDFYWGFNTTQVKVTKTEFYNPHYANWTTQHSQFFYNISSFSTTTESCDYGNDYNNIHRNATYQICSKYNETTGECEQYNITSSIGCFDSYEQEGTNYTIYWHTNHSRIDNWIQQNSFQLKHTIRDFKGYNEWWYTENFTVEVDKTYQTRVYVEVPITLEEISGKYYFAVKRSSETLDEAIANNHFYTLDPWYNSSWSHRKQWTVTNVNATTLTNYPAYINVSDEPEMQADWDDVVFTDSSGVKIPYELENYTVGFGDYWVNVTIPASSTVTGWAYYGNDAAVSQEDPEGVYDSHTKMVHHMQDLTDSTSNNNDATNHGATYTSSGQVDGAYDYNGSSDYWDCGASESLNATGALTATAWIKTTNSSTGIICGKHLSSSEGFLFSHTTIAKIGVKATTGVWVLDGTKTINDGNMHFLVATYDKNGISGEQRKLYVDSVLDAYDAVTGDIVNTTQNLHIGTRENADSLWFNGTIDNVIISSTARSADWINQSYEMIVNQSTWVVWEGAQYDTTFTVTLPIGYTYVHFNLTGVANPSTQTNYAPEGQNSTTEFYNVTNTGSSNLTVRMNINATITNVILKADTDNNPIGAHEINTTFAYLYTNLTCDNSIDIWLWTNLSHAIEQVTNRTLEINVTKS